jgi:DNA-binding HxlR family transcriptional regulator
MPFAPAGGDQRVLVACGQCEVQAAIERDGLITRTYHARVEYEISELGRSLSPVFSTLVRWSDRHMPEVRAARHTYDGGA